MPIKEWFLDKLEKLGQKKHWAAGISSLSGGCLAAVSYLGSGSYTRYIQSGLSVITALAGAVLLIPKRDRSREAVKGLLPFIDGDAEVFQSLERSADIFKLRKQACDDESPLAILVGAPLSGKSSLLRAGLIPALKSTNICYWQAKPDSTVDQLTAAIEHHFGHSYKELLSKPMAANAAPASTTTTTNDAEATKSSGPNDTSPPEDIRCRVVVIDHFDFLRPDHLPHEQFFTLLRELCDLPAPYRLKFIIAFRKPYGPVWHKIRQGLKVTPFRVPISSLDRDMAQRVMKTLLERARIAVHHRVIKAYVARFAWQEEVFPFAIGLGTAIFSVWAGEKNSQIKLKDYFEKGGQKGVIADHVEQHLRSLNTEHWEQIASSLYRKLVDDETGVRKMDGAEVRELADAAGINSSDMGVHLQTLAGSDVRILEQVDTEPKILKYRITQDCLVESLLAATEQTSAAASRLQWAFFEQFERWTKSRRWSKWKSLLISQQLKHWPPIQDIQDGSPDSERNQSIGKYIRQSRVFHFCKIATVVIVIASVLAATGIYLYDSWLFRQGTRQLKEGGIPGELYTTVEKSLDSLHIHTSTIRNFQWLHSKRLSELEVSSTAWDSLAGLNNAPHLHILTLNLTHAPIKELKQVGRLKELNALTMFLGDSHITNLDDLSRLKQLNAIRLSLDNGDIDFSSLAKLSALQTLNLDVQQDSGKNLQALAKLSNIKELALNLSNSPITELPDFSGLSKLTTLTLKAEHSDVRNFRSVNDLHSVKNLSLDLKRSNLESKGSTQLVELPDLLNLHSLECLDLDLTNTRLSELPPGLSGLEKLKTLTLRLMGTAIQHAPDLNSFEELENVTLDLNRADSQVQLPFGTEPRRRYHGLKSLTLEDQSFQTADIDKLNRFPFIHKLEIDIRSIHNGKLPSFTGIKELEDLTIHLYWSQIQSLPSLPSLTHLTLWVGEDTTAQPVTRLDASQLEGLLTQANPEHLELHLQKSRITDLPHFGNSNRIDILALYLSFSDIHSLANLSELKQLTKLGLDLEGCLAIDRIPSREVLAQLTDFTLNASSSSIANLDDLAYASQIQKLHLDLGDSKVTKLPGLTSLTGVTEFSANLNALSPKSLKEVKNLFGVKEVTVDASVDSIAELPPSVVRLHLGQPMSGELFFEENRGHCRVLKSR